MGAAAPLPKLVAQVAGGFQSSRQGGSMSDSAGVLAVSIASGLAIVVVFVALLWAALQDCRDERARREAGNTMTDGGEVNDADAPNDT